MSPLFTPISLRGLALENRIMVSPMCQYSAQDGCASDWHLMHLGSLAQSGAGLLFVEATAVTPEGRITSGCLGLFSEENEAALAHVIRTVRRWSDIPIGIQLGHSGRKGSSQAPWDGGALLAPGAGGWPPLAPSAVPQRPEEPPPVALDEAGIQRIRDAFAASAARAARIGFDAIELHFAHGYLLHEFLSPLANRRTDRYGGCLENRMRFPLEIFEAARQAWPAAKPLGVRVSATDWVEGGWDLQSSVALAHQLKRRGCDWIDCSSGGVSPQQKIALGPGYQVPFARRIRAETGITTAAIGLITEPRQAESIISNGDADMVALARGMLWDPHWPWHAAAELGGTVRAPKQYWRSPPRGKQAAFGNITTGQRLGLHGQPMTLPPSSPVSGPIDNLNVVGMEKMPTPDEVRKGLPLGEAAAATVLRGRAGLCRILERRDHRLFVVVGPCSIHDARAALEYAARLETLAREVEDTLLLVMRVYFEKPRTTAGWKGLINDPHLDDSFRIDEGIMRARELLLEFAVLGLPAGSEALDPLSPQYLADLISWYAIGARTTESQTHREMASGLSTPVGFKNGTDGGLEVALNAMKSAANPHSFLGIDHDGRTSIVRTRGNRYGHLVLRGGGGRPNYDTVSVRLAENALAKAGLPGNIIIDCSHANSLKDPALQPLVLADCVHQIREGNRSIVGLMLESNLAAGNQPIPADLHELRYGVSVTDACIDWDTTADAIRRAHSELRAVLPGRAARTA